MTTTEYPYILTRIRLDLINGDGEITRSVYLDVYISQAAMGFKGWQPDYDITIYGDNEISIGEAMGDAIVSVLTGLE